MKRRLHNLALALVSLCFLLSPIVFSSSAFAFKPDKNTDPAVLRKCISEVDRLIKEKGPSAKFYGTKAQLLEWLQEPEEASRQYSLAINLAPKDPYYYPGRARCFRLLKKWKAAIRDYDFAIAHGLKDTETYIGRSLAELAVRKYGIALEDAKRAISIDPQKSNAWWAKGHAELGLNRAGDSVKSLSRAIDLEPSEPAFYEIRSQAYQKLGDRRRADQDLVLLKQYSKKTE